MYLASPLFDPIRPERSLRRMAFTVGVPDYVIAESFIHDARPDLALARAIIEQEGK